MPDLMAQAAQPSLVELPVWVPSDRTAEFYQMIGRWLQGHETQPSPVAAVPAQQAQPIQPWGQDKDQDRQLAESLWEEFSPAARRVFAVIWKHGSVGANTVAREAGLASIHELAGVFNWPARQCAAAGRLLPCTHSPRRMGAETVYTMDGNARSAFSGPVGRV
jgi:hypothetical protein